MANYSAILGILNSSKIKSVDPALYQTIQAIISALQAIEDSKVSK